jgi:hypothetical protein
MKKMAVGVLSASLLFGGFFHNPLPTGAVSDSSNLVETASYSKTVTETKYYLKTQSIPSSISYNVGGWSGKLYRQGSPVDAGDVWIVTFSGTVTCSGPCSLPTAE